MAHLAIACQRQLEYFAEHRLGLLMLRHPATIASLAGCETIGCNVFLLDATASVDDIERLADEFQLSAIVRATSENSTPLEIISTNSGTTPLLGDSGMTILTSGTAGRPKAARHSWASLSRPIRITDVTSQQVWLLSYRLHLYAGMQVMLQSLANYGTLVMPAVESSPDDVVTMMRDQSVEYASATPSYWRRLVLLANRDVLATVPLKQLTLGGETVDQQILDSLASIFPHSRISHIYATTELGRCFSVTDGRAGFPATLLDAPTAEGIQLRVEESELIIRSANRMSGYAQRNTGKVVTSDGISADGTAAWFATGDLVEQRGDRVYFVGRRTEMINVGGNKVSPLVVENVIRSVEGIADVRVYGKSSSIAGQLVACEIVVDKGCGRDRIKQALIQQCSQSLDTFQQPRVIRIVDSINLTTSSKISRRGTN